MSLVLIVHADRIVSAELAAAIALAGHETRVATTGERAMDCFIQEPADVVVIDRHLHGRDGLKAAEAIRWMPGGRRARLILTAATEPESGTLAELGRGVDAFAVLVGPQKPEALAALVDRAASVRPHDAETRVLTAEQARIFAERASGDADGATTVLGGEAIATPNALDLPSLEEDDSLAVEDAETSAPLDDEWARDANGRAEGREVRAMAEEAARIHSELVGSFESMPFARLLHRMAQKRATGALVCVHPLDERVTTEGAEPTKVVYFRAGVPVHVRSNLVSECLGQVLMRQRTIGPATLRESLSAIRRGEGLQGEVLVAMGALSPLELSEALAEQLRCKLFELFGWQRGTFRFTAQPPPAELIELGLGLAEIAYLGVREGMTPARVIEQLARERDSLVIPQPRELVRFVRLHIPDSVRELIGAIDGSHTVRELLERSPDRAGAAQLLYAMACLEAVRFRRPARPEPPPTSTPPTVETPPVTKPARPLPESHAAPVEAEAPPSESEPPNLPEPATIEEPEPASEPDQAAEAAPPSREEVRESSELLDAKVEQLLAAERAFRRGQHAMERDRPAEAALAFARAAKLYPEEGRFLAHWGWALHRSAPEDTATLAEALELVERACTLAPKLAAVHLLRARLLLAAGRKEQAYEAFDRVLQLEPENPEAAQARRELQ